MKKLEQLKILSILLLCFWSVQIEAMQLEMEFNYLTNRDGLSNSQVNAIMQDNKGFVWFGTQAGLDRYDGFRFKTFLYKNHDESSLPNNSVDEVQQDVKGNLWIHTAVGYCIYQYENERFDRKPEKWLARLGIKGNPSKVLIDCNKNMWFVVYGRGCYFLNSKTMRSHFFSFKEMGMSASAEVSSVTDNKGTAILSFKNAAICRLDGLHRKVMWTNRYLTDTYKLREDGSYTFVDAHSNYWVLYNGLVFIYSVTQKKWYEGMQAFLKAQGISMPVKNKILVRDIANDKDGRLWIATDHDGLFLLDYRQKLCKQYVKREGVVGSLPDNSLQKVYIDKNGSAWIGAYKGGIAYYSPSFTKFSTIPLGDVCTITQDRAGNYWCGTNDAGIVCYNPITRQQKTYGSSMTGLKSDIVVSSVTMSDGTMFFGTFNGGLARYRDGVWKVYFSSSCGLANNSIWSLAEDKKHRLVIGTLGGGIQFMDTQKESFLTLNIGNSTLPSNFISSLYNMPNGNIIVGHSQNVSVLNPDTYQLLNYSGARNGRAFPSPSVNAAISDSRGIFWLATPAGITMYDPNTGQMESINDLNGTQGAVGCSIVEDKGHAIWVVSEFIVSRVKLSKNQNGQWNMEMTSYNYMDGLQERQFNYRSVYLAHNGDVVIGGQEGINVIHPQFEHKPRRRVKAIFSGLVLFDHPLMAGEEFEGKVILGKSLDECRNLNLSYKDNAFTVQLASSDVAVPSRNRFLYRMEGVTDKWLMTATGRPEVTFTNLSPGSYTLQVKVVNGDGSIDDEISELDINVLPPFYLSIWALMIYILIICMVVYLYRKRVLDRQQMRFEKERMEENIRKDRELNELKLRFFTNVSHELRTPLTLIISPLDNLIKKECDVNKKRKLELIYRNANRLLTLVNQILDFRKIEQNRGKLTLSQVELVSYIENICTSFQLLGNSKINLQFVSDMPSLSLVCDVDKMGKVVNNLLSNAYKFTPDGGKVSVHLGVEQRLLVDGKSREMMRIEVADTGKGISAEDKKHIFERFYQVEGTEKQPFGGSGIGLNLVKSFVDLHEGVITVADNPMGGTIFTVDIPMDLQMERVPLVNSSSVSLEEKNITENKPCVLLVDDSDDFREFMCDVLSETYHVIEAVNGKDGWEKLQNHRPDIILSDVMMPEMDGNEFCRLVKETPATANIPFVMLTARLAIEHQKEGLGNGADDYVTKPFDIDLLNLRIKGLIAKTHQQRSGGLAQLKTVTAESRGTVGEDGYVLNENDKKFLRTVDEYIQENMGDPDTSVESMSAYLLISRVQLYKRMVSLTGTTPSEYLRAKRIHRSEELLRDSAYNISEVAYKVGFNNPRYFSKYFQEEYGVTPSQYRKQLLS